MKSGAELDMGTGCPVTGETYYCLQKRHTHEFWNGGYWHADPHAATRFSGIEAALECAQSLRDRSVDFVAVFARTNGRITIPLE